jgi:hypothetical protein
MTEANNNKSAQKIGDTMPDGSIYAGTSPDTGKPMYAMPKDASFKRGFNDASKYQAAVNERNELGHNDWRLASNTEMKAMFNNLAAAGGFDTSGAYPAGWYWTATKGYDMGEFVKIVRASDGKENDQQDKMRDLSVRLIRG